MSEEIKEQMSALVDGELEVRSASRVIDVLLESDEMQAYWSRCHVVRDVLRHKAYSDAGTELCKRVRGCLADEPLHFPARRLLPRRWSDTLKPAAGVALAASVAVAAILAVRGLDEIPVEPRAAGIPAVQVAAHRPSAVIPASATDSPPASLRRLQWNTAAPAVAHRLNGYLVNHSEHLGGPIGGLHPYARIVGYDTAGQR
jgi:sigma-E factor negative regulatory protein RseA